MIRTIVIDDEKSHREFLISMIQNNFPKIKIVGEAEGIHSGLNAIKKCSPDLVILDIGLNDGEGFDILRKLKKIDFKIIFITKVRGYAARAIKFSPIDFLVKPVTLADLKAAIERAKDQIIEDMKIQLTDMQTNVLKMKSRRIILRTSEKIHLIQLHDIVRCEASRNYSNFFLDGGKKITVCQPMKDFEELLTEQDFFRIHKSHIVNLSFVETYIKSDGGMLILSDGSSLPVADRKKASLLEKFDNI